MTLHRLEPVVPVRPVAPYIGGKRALAQRVAAVIAAIPHDLYAEPFVGMGGVFFRRSWRPRIEIINDVSADVVTLFRILQRHYQAFLDTLKWQLCSRAEFDRLMQTEPATLTDIERAARFLYLQRATFGGKVTSRAYGMASDGPARFDPSKLVPMLEAVHDRLCGVHIERLPYGDFLAQFDRPDALFYLDPPYWGSETDYGADVFSPADFDRLAEILAALQGRFVLSINDTPGIRQIFADFAMREVELSYTIGTATAAKELIITNADPACLEAKDEMGGLSGTLF